MDQIDFKSSRNANQVGRDGGQTSIGRNGQQALSYYDPALSQDEYERALIAGNKPTDYEGELDDYYAVRKRRSLQNHIPDSYVIG